MPRFSRAFTSIVIAVLQQSLFFRIISFGNLAFIFHHSSSSFLSLFIPVFLLLTLTSHSPFHVNELVAAHHQFSNSMSASSLPLQLALALISFVVGLLCSSSLMYRLLMHTAVQISSAYNALTHHTHSRLAQHNGNGFLASCWQSVCSCILRSV